MLGGSAINAEFIAGYKMLALAEGFEDSVTTAPDAARPTRNSRRDLDIYCSFFCKLIFSSLGTSVEVFPQIDQRSRKVHVP